MKLRNVFILLLVVGLIVFGNSISNKFVLDDYDQLVKNLNTHSVSNIGNFFLSSTFYSGGAIKLSGIYYKPLMLSFFSVIYSMFGENPLPFHLFQILVHMANGFLVYLLFKRFFGEKMSLFLSLVFLVHPINSEAVVYISALQDVLFTFFGLLALLLKNKRLSALFLLLSLLSKETAVLFLFIYPAFKYLDSKKIVWIPSVVSLVSYLVIRLGIAQVGFGSNQFIPIARASLDQRLLSLPKIIFYYLSNLIFPFNLAVSQEWVVSKISRGNFYMPLIIDGAALLVILILGWLLWKVRDKVFGTYLFFGIWFLLGLGIHSQIIPLDMTVADRWFYLPMVGLLGLFGVVLTQAKDKFPKRLLKISLTLGVVIILLFSVRTVIRNFNWTDEFSLASHDLRSDPSNFVLLNSLGDEYFNRGNYQEAQNYYQLSVNSAPYHFINWNNLGVVYEREGYLNKDNNDFNKALSAYRRSIDNGNYYLSYENLAKMFYFTNQTKQAKDFCLNSLKSFPNNSPFWLILALSDYKLGDKESAVLEAKQAYLLNPIDQNLNIYQVIAQGGEINLKPF